ncbi:hypothetical protein EV644_105279 [Kribbella orskensis]|uniref:Small secreted domain DUF320 n=1 Tax=Kribbella orskensis TaxID=2512216 RepID=A0ABY2BLH5_9ACTN|nr:hypothetical protein EV642_104279 [Kribbella sp. VKM Ac-2500]TCO24246.1 hypothetical protein EV644_105279 [Kribbella orskensis]
MTRQKASAALGIAALGISGVVATNPPARAAGNSPQHCVSQLGSTGQQCFASLGEAISAATNGMVSDAPAAGPPAGQE